LWYSLIEGSFCVFKFWKWDFYFLDKFDCIIDISAISSLRKLMVIGWDLFWTVNKNWLYFSTLQIYQGEKLTVSKLDELTISSVNRAKLSDPYLWFKIWISFKEELSFNAVNKEFRWESDTLASEERQIEIFSIVIFLARNPKVNENYLIVQKKCH
jgi:hypothetical protein